MSLVQTIQNYSLKLFSFLKLYWLGFVYGFAELFWSNFKQPNVNVYKESSSPMDERPVVLLTGGYGDLGTAIADKLLQLGFDVVLVGRNQLQGEETVHNLNINNNTDGGTVSFICCDLSSRTSLKLLVAKIKKTYSKLHLLINNAGVMLIPYNLTPDGHELHFAVNFLSHAYLSLELLPLLSKTGLLMKEADSICLPKIVDVTSATLYAGNIDRILAQNSISSTNYSPHAAYADSKLASALFIQVLQRHLAATQRNIPQVALLSLHPGVIPTKLYRHVWSPFQYLIRRFPGPKLLRTIDQAAEDVIQACLNPSAKNGYYYEHGIPQPIPICSTEQLERLWNNTLEELDLKSEI